jgi:hypothetical protein
MNTNTRHLSQIVTALALLCFLALFTGCSGKSKIPNEINYIPERLIQDYSDMQENEFVSWAWVRRGFALSNCRSITFEPVIDSSRLPNPAAVQRFEQGLQALFEVYSNENGEHEVKIQTAVIDVKSNPGRIKKMFLDFDSDPYIEVEIMITDQATGLPLVKIIHFNRDNKSLKNAVSAILDDVKRFLIQSV